MIRFADWSEPRPGGGAIVLRLTEAGRARARAPDKESGQRDTNHAPQEIAARAVVDCQVILGQIGPGQVKVAATTRRAPRPQPESQSFCFAFHRSRGWTIGGGWSRKARRLMTLAALNG